MKKGKLCVRFFIAPRLKVCLEKVASMAGKRKVLENIGPAASMRVDMFHLEQKIEDGFRRMAVFATIDRTFGNGRILRIHG